jgi:hypothetical protein
MALCVLALSIALVCVYASVRNVWLTGGTFVLSLACVALGQFGWALVTNLVTAREGAGRKDRRIDALLVRLDDPEREARA